MKSAIVLGTIGIGMLFLALSGIWTSLNPATSAWTPEKGKRASEVKARIHNLSFIVNAPVTRLHSGQDLGALKAEYEQLRKEHDQLNADFQSAYDRPNTIAKILKWAGLSLAGLGIVGWYAVKNMES